MNTFTIPLQLILLSIIIIIGLYNWFYRMRIDKIKHQLGVELPGISIALMKIGTFFALFSVSIIAFFIFFMK